MDFIPIKTRKFVPGKDRGQLLKLLDDYLPRLQEKDVVVITSKIVAIHQGRCVPARSMKQKLELIKQEADAYFPGNVHGLTLKDMALIPYAGIDRTNAANHYVMWPKNPPLAAKAIWKYLRRRHRLKQLGVIIIDSFCLPLRWGHYGLSIGFWGFHPNHSYNNQKDIFGNKIIQGNSNLVDALAALSGALMGEGREQTPLLLIRGFSRLKFTPKNTLTELKAYPKKDMYAPLLHFLHVAHRVQK